MPLTPWMLCIIIMPIFYFHFTSGLRNFALNKPAYQSSTLNYNKFDWTADKAVDGNTDGRNPDTSKTCSETVISKGNHTWEVDVGFLFIVKSVIVYERSDGNDQLSSFQVFIGYRSKPWIGNQPLEKISSRDFQHVFHANNSLARFISVIRLNKETMTLCEVMVHGECLDGMYSAFCNRTCGQCSNGEPCNKDTGECLRGCEPGWTGILCDKGLRNFALNKPAYQSSTLNYNKFDWTADKAVDGNTDGRNPDTSKTCSETVMHMDNHTWEVDVGFLFIVKSVIVYERSDGNDQLSGFQVFIGYRSKPWIGNQPLEKISSRDFQHVFHANDSLARFISVIRLNKETMTLCEVMVHGECLDGMYSAFCNRTCGQCSNGEPCNKDTGECLRGCEPGWTGIVCDKECEKGTYGSGCTYTCGMCLNGNETCSAVDGRCSLGCHDGWQGQTCKNNSSEKQPLSRDDMTVIGGSVAGVCIGALVISIIIITALKKRRNIFTGDSNTETKETGVRGEEPSGDSAVKERITQSYYNVASLSITTTTNSKDDRENAAQITEAEYEDLQDPGRIESSIYSTINCTEIDGTN